MGGGERLLIKTFTRNGFFILPLLLYEGSGENNILLIFSKLKESFPDANGAALVERNFRER